MKADLVAVDLAGADIAGTWRQGGWVGEQKGIITPYLCHLSTCRVGLDKPDRNCLLVQPENTLDVWPSLGWLINLVRAEKVVVLEQVMSVTRILNPGDIVIPSRALVSSGANSPKITSLISRRLYADLIKAVPVRAPSRIFHRGSYCIVSGDTDLEAYMLEQGYNLGFEVAGRGLNGAGEHIPQGVEIASVSVVEGALGAIDSIDDIQPFSQSVCPMLIQMISAFANKANS